MWQLSNFILVSLNQTLFWKSSQFYLNLSNIVKMRLAQLLINVTLYNKHYLLMMIENLNHWGNSLSKNLDWSGIEVVKKKSGWNKFLKMRFVLVFILGHFHAFEKFTRIMENIVLIGNLLEQSLWITRLVFSMKLRVTIYSKNSW